MSYAALDLDLDVFQGPFDLLITLILREEIDLLDVDLADVVLAYIEYLEERGELDLEATTEFLVLIAALLELKSRMMLPAAEGEELELEPAEAAEELLARMLEYRRYRSAAAWLAERLAAEAGYRYRAAPPPRHLRRVELQAAEQIHDPMLLGGAIEGLLRMPPPLNLSHLGKPIVTVGQRVDFLRSMLASRGSFGFDDAVAGADRITEAITIFALLELYKQGEASWEQKRAFGPITVTGRPVATGERTE